MSEHSPAQIQLGGCISRRLVPRLCRAIREADVACDWGEVRFQPDTAEDLLAARRHTSGEQVLTLCDDSAVNGRFDELEAFLVKHQIPFDLFSDSGYDQGPTCAAYRPESGLSEWVASADGVPQLAADGLWHLAADLKAAIARIGKRPRPRDLGRLTSIARQLIRAIGEAPAPLPSFEIGRSLGLRCAA